MSTPYRVKLKANAIILPDTVHWRPQALGVGSVVEVFEEDDTVSYHVRWSDSDGRITTGWMDSRIRTTNVDKKTKICWVSIGTERAVSKWDVEREKKFLEKFHPTFTVVSRTTSSSKEKHAMSTKTKRTKKSATKKSAVPSKNGATTGRASMFSGKKITKLVKENPRREGTHGHHSWKLITNGMTYEAYIKAGGRREDLAWDLLKKNIKLS